MKVWEEHESHDVECDRVQRIHTLENLAELLMHGYGYDYDDDCELSSLNEDELYRQAEELRSEFIKRSRGQVMAEEEAYVVCKKTVEEAKYEVHIHSTCYLMYVLAKLHLPSQSKITYDYDVFQADRNQAKFLGELPEELETKENSRNQPSPSPQDKDGAETSSLDNDQTRPGEDNQECGDEAAREQNTSTSGQPDMQNDSATAQKQLESENSTFKEDTQTEKDEPECMTSGEGEKSTNGDDESGERKSPAIIAEEKTDTDHREENEGDGGALEATKGSVVEQEKEKERPAIVSYMHTMIQL